MVLEFLAEIFGCFLSTFNNKKYFSVYLPDQSVSSHILPLSMLFLIWVIIITVTIIAIVNNSSIIIIIITIIKTLVKPFGSNQSITWGVNTGHLARQCHTAKKLSKNSTKTATWKLAPSPFVFPKN